jgi:ABC-type uncharacterized transport system permease subunit
MDRLLLVISTFCFLFGFAYTMHSLGSRVYRHSKFNFFATLGGFVFQTAFLYLRGQQIGRCPLTNLFEVLIFLSWSMVLFYLLIGPTYRLSLLGAFTSPLVFLFQIGALLTPGIDVVAKPLQTPNVWLELHAAISVVAYGALALACVAGVMYLAQERQLKTHHVESIFYHLPPIRDLAVANRRLVLAGFGLLTVGLIAGFAMGNTQAHLIKIAWSVGVWILYSVILVGVVRHKLSGHRVALLSVVAFSAVLGTLWGLTFIFHPLVR